MPGPDRNDTVGKAEGRPPETADPRLVARTEDHLFGFLRALHDAGLSVPATKQRDFFAGIEALRPSDTGPLYWIGVATLLTHRSAQPVYDSIFEQFFTRPQQAALIVDEPAPRPDSEAETDDEQTNQLAGDNNDNDTVLDQPGGSGLAAASSAPESPTRFAPTGPVAAELMDQIADVLPELVPRTRSRRQVPGRRRHRVDLRAVYRQAYRTQGEIIQLRWRHRPTRQRRMLVLIDVSGSMKQHSPDYLRFAHVVVGHCRSAEVFTFGTRLTRVTAPLRHSDVDVALDSLAQVVLDADGGTRIGESLQELLSGTQFVTMARGAVVLVLSDGLERGDCTAMAGAVRRLSQLSHRLFWWSPLACDPDYRPLTRGMAAATPHLDALIGVRDLATALSAVRNSFSPSPSPSPSAPASPSASLPSRRITASNQEAS